MKWFLLILAYHGGAAVLPQHDELSCRKAASAIQAHSTVARESGVYDTICVSEDGDTIPLPPPVTHW